MKLYRGVSEKVCKEYKKGIPKGTKFTTNKKSAMMWGKCIIFKERNKNFELHKESRVFKELKMSERYYTNKKIIKRFK